MTKCIVIEIMNHKFQVNTIIEWKFYNEFLKLMTHTHHTHKKNGV